jgi:GTP pyrophosphokinase
MVTYTTITADEFLAKTAYLNTTDRLQLEEALEFARQEHGAQRRKTGELFFIHPLTVASYLAEYRLDAAALSAALLHDIAEDTRISIRQIEERFSPEIARLVLGVTKLKEVSSRIAETHTLTPDELKHATLLRLLEAMTADVRTVIIKLFDRLHNMRTIKAMPPDKQVQKAEETLSVFGPLAYRLGMWEVKSELEWLSLEVVNPDAYHIIKGELEQLQCDQLSLFEVVRAEVKRSLDEAGLPVVDIRMAPENIYTVYKDLLATHASYQNIDRTLRLVIVLDEIIDCYTTVGHVHRLWPAVAGRFDDYISVRRDNLYQSLHTTVVHSSGQQVKFRIRTPEMDKVAQIGVLTRWLYAGTPLWSAGIADSLESFFANIKVNIDAEPQDPIDGVRGVVKDTLGEQVRVHTPRGEVRELVRGATPIDFAYAIHTELGNQCVSAIVNRRPYPLNKALRDGDVVYIERNARSGPRRAWVDEDLGYIRTNYARNKAKRWFRRLPRAEALAQGQQLVQHELEMLGLPEYAHETVAGLLALPDKTELYHRLGRAELSPTELSTRVAQELWDHGPSLQLGNVVKGSNGARHVIAGADNYTLRLCSTCQPRPRDPIVGFLRKDRGVTVHREGCHSLNANRQRGDGMHRQLKLSWGRSDVRLAKMISVMVDVYDRSGLLYEITQLMQDQDINIAHICTLRDVQPGMQKIELQLEMISPRQLVGILHQIEALVNVQRVRRIPDLLGSGRSPDESYKPARTSHPFE